MVNDESAKFLNDLPSYDGHKMVYVYYLTQLRPEIGRTNLFVRLKT
jgi:hypothetical protein